MSYPTPDTELDAVNSMLHDIGERPVNTLDNQSRLDVLRAIDSLRKASRTTQETGWWFNRELVTVPLDSNNQYPIDASWTHVTVVDGGPAVPTDGNPVKLVARDGFLYDLGNERNEFEDGDADVDLEVIRMLDFESLPNTAREYIYCAASIRFQSRTLGSSAVDADLREQANIALISLREEDINFEAIDQKTLPHFFNLMWNR